MGSMAHAVSATYFLGIMPSILLTIVLAVVCIIIAKQRSGPTRSIDVMWRGEQTKYYEIDTQHEE